MDWRNPRSRPRPWACAHLHNLVCKRLWLPSAFANCKKYPARRSAALEGPTAIKSGARTVGLLIPLKTADPDRLAAVLARAEELARSRDLPDDAALAAYGPVDPVDWSIEAVRALTAKPVIPLGRLRARSSSMRRFS